MAEHNKSGCGRIAIVVGVLLFVGALAMVAVPALWLRVVRKEHSLEEARMRAAEVARMDRAVLFPDGEIPDFPPHRRGEEVTREEFVALMIDDLATELARREFQKTADGAPVRWLLETRDISGGDGALRGNFTLPYWIVSGNRRQGSAVNLDCEFLPESRDALLRVRRGDWVVVEGRLSFDGRDAAITEARLVDDMQPRAERP